MAIVCIVVTLLGCGRGGPSTPVLPSRGGHAVMVAPPVRLLRRFKDWICIHGHEAAWNDPNDPYWGGLQMDRSFMRSYGSDIMKLHHGGLANVWTPAEQIRVAERAYVSGRGFYPWPNTARMCGLI